MDESSKFLLKLTMIFGLTRHCPGSHRISHTVFFASFGISLSYFRMVCKSQIIVETPYEDFSSVKPHVRSQFTCKIWKHKITFCYFLILSQRTSIPLHSFKNIHINFILKLFSALQKYK